MKMWRDECVRIIDALADLAGLPRDPCPGWEPCIEKIKAMLANMTIAPARGICLLAVLVAIGAKGKEAAVIESDDIVLKANVHYQAQSLQGQAAEFACRGFRMRMAADSRVVSLTHQPDGRELLDPAGKSPGFYMSDGPGGARIAFGNLYKLSDTLFMVTTPRTGYRQESQKIVFSVTNGENYLAFRILELIGIPTTANYQIFFDLAGGPDLRAAPLDYMTFSNFNADHSDDRRLPVSWPAPWVRGQDHKGEKIPLGGFALYVRSGAADEDETLTHIWVNEGLPHPKVDWAWDAAGVKRWMDLWVKEFSDRSAFWYSHPKDPGEIDRLLPYLEKMGVKEFHLYHWTWQDPYGHCRVARNAFFPNGREDLIELANRLRGLGINLSLHYNFCEIPLSDPVRIGTTPSRHLAAWGAGSLARAIDPEADTIYFKPDRGTELPSRENHQQVPPALDAHMHYNFLRIEDEIVRFRDALNSNGETWELVGCERGVGTTEPAAHADGAQAEGLIAPFGIMFSPATYGPLFDEMVHELTDLWNEGQLRNIEYDGTNPAYWSGAAGTQYRRWLGQTYGQFDHPTWFGTGSHYQRWGHFEYWFNASRITQPVRLGFRGDMGVRPRTASLSRAAATMDEAHARMSQVAAVNGNEFGMSLPLHYPSDWERYGRFEEMVDAVVNWKSASRMLTDEQRRKIRDTLKPPLTRGFCSDIVWWLRKEDGETRIYPQKNPLVRRSGDVMWGNNGGEVGWITPEQYIRFGDSLELENPFAEQPPMFTLRVMSRTDCADKDNIDLFTDIAAIRNPTEMKVERDGRALRLSYDNAGSNDVDARDGSLLAACPGDLDLSGHRALGLWIVGDGSGATLVVRVAPHRDYAVKLDFDGKRYVEIPNAEAYWTDANWGGPNRSQAAAFNYKPHEIGIGFGHVPAATKVSVVVEAIRALKEHESTVERPVIAIDGKRRLTVQGNVSTSQWLDYRGGETAALYDQDWNKLADLPVVPEDYAAGTGWHTFTVSAERVLPNTWMAVRFITEGDPIAVEPE